MNDTEVDAKAWLGHLELDLFCLLKNVHVQTTYQM